MPVSNERYRRLLEAAEVLANHTGDDGEWLKAERVIEEAHEHLLTAKRTEVMK